LIEFGKSNKGLDVFIMRPSGVTPKDRSVLKSIAASVAPMIRVNELAASMLDVAVHGAEKLRFIRFVPFRFVVAN
jgi:hypothetical protein